jgi:nucleotide-binding universal stress UspA family protein
MTIPPRTIVVPITLSRDCNERTAAAARLAETLGAELVLVGIAPLVPPAQWSARVSRFVLLDREREAQRVIDRLVAERLEELRAAVPVGVRARTVVTWGPVEKALTEVAEAEGADMIVVSMRDWSPFTHLFCDHDHGHDHDHGSLLHQSDVPVLIVPEPRSAAVRCGRLGHVAQVGQHRTRRWPLGVGGRPSLWKMLVTCFSTAAMETTNSSATPWFDLPSAIAASTSRSRGVSSLSGPVSRRPSMSPTTSGSSALPLWATRVTASTNASTSPTRSLSR